MRNDATVCQYMYWLVVCLVNVLFLFIKFSDQHYGSKKHIICKCFYGEIMI